MNPYLCELFLSWIKDSHRVLWTHDIGNLRPGDFCFSLSCGQIIPPSVLEQYRHNLVVHESGLPKGKGWSPLTWQILAGENRIPVTLLEAAERVDSGVIYAQEWLEFEGHELIGELREAQARATINLCKRFIDEYPHILAGAREQIGEESFYPRRFPSDSRLNPEQTLTEQLNLVRVADNDRYPVFFELIGHRYQVKIEKD